jgi:hypothetical protein
MRNATLIFLWALLGGLAGCSEYRQTTPELNFAHLPRIVLDVREAQIDSRYRSPGTPSHIEQTVKPTPEAALIRWAQQRLRSDGTQNIARFTILSAPLTAENLRKSSGLTGALTTEPEQRWTVTVEAQLEILDESGRRLDGYTAKVTRTRDVLEGLTYEERDRFWYDLLSATMAEFDAEMITGIRQYAAPWLR